MVANTGWTNWFGNQSCRPHRRISPRHEADLQAVVANAARRGLPVRVVGGGHSLPPVVPTDGVLVDLDFFADWPVIVDEEAQLATIPAARRLSQIFDPLWRAGFAMKNLGELADSTIAGAVSTGAHGTGLTLPCTSAGVVAMRVVTATGDLLEISRESDPNLLRAAQVSIGMLGVMTSVTIGVMPAYDLVENSTMMAVDEVVERWEELSSTHRHFNFYYIATPAAAAAFGDQLDHLPADAADVCYATMIDAIDPSTPPSETTSFHRRDRMNRILTIEFDPTYRETEYAVPLEDGLSTFLEIRDLIRSEHTDYSFPMNVRFVSGDDAFLSAYSGGPRVVFSISDDPAAPWSSILGPMEELFLNKGGRPHWGKEHTLQHSQAQKVFPDLDRFVAIRRELDPDGVFLNDHLRELFA